MAKQKALTGTELRNKREVAGLTQQQMADQLGVNLRLYQKYEGSETRIRNIVRLAIDHVLHCK